MNYGTCQKCKRRILWIKTVAGKNMPVNPELKDYRRPEHGEKGKEKIVTPKGEVISANIVSSKDAEGTGYISHFATCTGYRK